MSGNTVPASLEDATSPQWIGSILGAEVATVSVGQIDERVSTNVPIFVELADGSQRNLWIKGYFSELVSRFRVAGIPEAMFYRKLSRWVGIRTLQPVYAEVDPDSLANVVVTEDVANRGATFLDALSPYTVDQAAESLEQLARLHAATWMHTVGGSTWLTPRLSSYTVARGVADIRTNFEGTTGDGVPESVRDADRLYSAYEVVAADAAKATPWAVIHGDPHIGNLFVDAAGRPTFLDWQLVQRGPWYLDVGYHLASSLTVERRRQAETELVEHYLDHLAGSGVERPSDDEVRHGLRRSFLHGFYLWAITLKVDPAITATLLERLGTAVDDHAALAEV